MAMGLGENVEFLEPVGDKFVITELERIGTGTLKDTKQKFVWTPRQHSMPEKPIEIPITVNTSRESEVGTTRPVEQVLSSAIEPFDFNGTWDDKFAGSGFAQRMRRDFSEFVARAPLVRVEWQQEAMVGIMQRLIITYLRRTKMRYAVTFSPHSEAFTGDIIRPTIAPIPIQARIDEIKTQIDIGDLLQSELGATLPVTDDLFKDTSSIYNGLKAKLDNLNSTFKDKFGVVEQATENLKNISFIFGDIRGSAQSMLLKLASVRSDVNIAYRNTQKALAIDEWSRGMSALARTTILVSTDAKADVDERVFSVPKRLYRPFKGQNIYSVALQVYGNTASWRAIVKANNLVALTFDGTEELVIPKQAVTL